MTVPEFALVVAEFFLDDLVDFVAGGFAGWTTAGSVAFTAFRKSKLSIEYSGRWPRAQEQAISETAINRGKRIIRGST